MFKFWFKPENAWLGIANENVEGGLKAMQHRWPDIEFELEEVEVPKH